MVCKALTTVSVPSIKCIVNAAIISILIAFVVGHSLDLWPWVSHLPLLGVELNVSPLALTVAQFSVISSICLPPRLWNRGQNEPSFALSIEDSLSEEGSFCGGTTTMAINIYGALLVSSVPSGVWLECGHFPFHTGLETSLWQRHRGTVGLSLHGWGDWQVHLFSQPPECHYPPLTLDGERIYFYCHLTIGPPQGQVQPAV